jgi:hypothetical protein
VLREHFVAAHIFYAWSHLMLFQICLYIVSGSCYFLIKRSDLCLVVPYLYVDEILHSVE